jgi:predicted Zn-dependent peptidase
MRPVRCWICLDPAAFDKNTAQLNEVTPNAVKMAAKRLLAKEHRVVVIAGPGKKASDPLAMP